MYHRGNLAADREDVLVLTNHSNPVHCYYEPMHSLGQMAWQAYERGLVELVQKVYSDGNEYIAVKRYERRQR